MLSNKKVLVFCFVLTAVNVGLSQKFYTETLFDSKEQDTTWIRVQQDEFRHTEDVENILSILLKCSTTDEQELLARKACSSACVAGTETLNEEVDSSIFNEAFSDCEIEFNDIHELAVRTWEISRDKHFINYWYNRISNPFPYERWYYRNKAVSPRKFNIKNGNRVLIINASTLDLMHDFISKRKNLFLCQSNVSEMFLRRMSDEIVRYAPFNSIKNEIRIIESGLTQTGAETLIFDKIILTSWSGIELSDMLTSIKRSMHSYTELYIAKTMYLSNNTYPEGKLQDDKLVEYLEQAGFKSFGKLTYTFSYAINHYDKRTMYKFKLKE